MRKFKGFLQRKNIIFSGKRYGIDALGAMAQGLFCTLLVGTILEQRFQKTTTLTYPLLPLLFMKMIVVMMVFVKQIQMAL